MTAIEPGQHVEYGSVEGFDSFVAAVEPPLRRALVATYGPERGREAAAEALAWAWEHRDRLGSLDHPVRYLYRVGQSRGRRRLTRIPFVRSEWRAPEIEPGLEAALGGLSERQRAAAVLVHGFGWTLGEVAELLEVTTSTVQTHLERAMERLRAALEVE